ncbi:MAG: hypothetical protein O2930_02420 [Acidobacteria bacterium]|nr:hypothetical protein [Acidobacteriota bacterium]
MRMRTKVLTVLGLVALICPDASAQYMVHPDEFLPSLPATKTAPKTVAPPTVAPDVESTLYKAADFLGMLRRQDDIDAVLTVDYQGTGTKMVGGQSRTLNSYRGTVRYDVPGMRADFTVAEPAGEPSRHVEVVAGDVAWNESEPGAGLVPGQGVATPMPDAVVDRLLQIWTLPHGLVKAAVAAGASTTVTLEDGVVYVNFPLPAPLMGTAKVRLNTTDVTVHTLDNGDQFDITNRIESVVTNVDGVMTETTFSNYGDWNEADYKSDVMFPGRIVRRRGGQTLLDLTVTLTNTYNPYVIMPVPPGIGGR